MQADGASGAAGAPGTAGSAAVGLPKVLHSLDAWEFCRLGKTLEGEIAASSLTRHFGRLAESLVASPASIQDDGKKESPVNAPLKWRIEGFCDRDGRCTMRISGRFDASQECLRCGLPVQAQVAFDRLLHLCKSEQEADTLETGEDEDAVAAPGKVDVALWLEDEMLLCLPMFPAHGQCEQNQPTPVNAGVANETNEVQDETHRPFEQLASLLKNRSGNK